MGSFPRTALGFTLALLVLGASPPLGAWKQVLEEQPVQGARAITETRWQLERPRGGERDRIQLHRYRGEAPTRAALLYLPGMHMNGYLPGRRGDLIYAPPEEDHNLWLFLAKRGVDVYTLDYRSHFVTTDPADHAFMRQWTLDRYVEDALQALAQTRAAGGHERVFVAGFSMGVTLAYGVVNVAAPEDVAGLVVLDGSFKQPPGGRSFDRAKNVLMVEKMQRWSIDVAARMGWENRHRLMAAVIDDPAQPREDKPEESVGDRLARLLGKSWANTDHSDLQVLASLLIGYDRYFPAMVGLESRSVASVADDPATGVDDRFGRSGVPVIYFGATGFGPRHLLSGIYSAVRLGRGDVRIHVQEGWGHLDVLVADDAREEIFQPLLEWIEARAGE